jgi:hypothetical protein
MNLETAKQLVQSVVEDLAFQVDLKAAVRYQYRQKLTEASNILTSLQSKGEKEETRLENRLAGHECCDSAQERILELERLLLIEKRKQETQISSVIGTLKSRLLIQNEKQDEFKKEVRNFLEFCSNDDKGYRKSRIGSPFSSVAKPSPRFRRQADSSFAQESKADAKNLLSYFDKNDNKENQSPQKPFQVCSSSKFSDGSLLPPRLAESAEKKGLKKNFMTFKNAIYSEEKTSERKAPQSYASELDLPDFTLECMTNREIDPQRIANQYEIGDSCQRPLLHVDEADLNDVRSLPISLKGSSTFQ